jgi:hypothetical protein
MAAQVKSQVLTPTIPCRYANSVSRCHQEQLKSGLLIGSLLASAVCEYTFLHWNL